jgi:hypothetical protein
MKVNKWATHGACLASFTLFALPTPAQNQEIQLPANIHWLPTAAGSQKNTRANGQTQQEVAAVDVQKQAGDISATDATTSCAYTFTTGSGPTYMKFCVTANGNITQFESPAGNEQINVQKVGEGYELCAFTRSTAYLYYDYGETASANWGPSTLLSLTATEVKIERTTSDGIWTLTQTITAVGGQLPYAKVEMQFKYNSATPSTALPTFLRWVNVDASDTALNNLDSTADSAWGYVKGAYGLMMQSIAPSDWFLEGVVFDSPSPTGSGLTNVNTCGGNFSGGLTNTDGSMGLLYLGEPSAPRDFVYTMTFKYKAY